MNINNESVRRTSLAYGFSTGAGPGVEVSSSSRASVSNSTSFSLLLGGVGVDVEGIEGMPLAEGVGPKNVCLLSPGRLALFPAAACSLISNAFNANAL